MKITGNQGVSVNISAGRELGSLLKNINPGDLISASVLRSEGNKAMLEIGGRIITAEFTNGVPKDKIIDLVLTAKSSEKIQFALKENETSDRIFKLLSPFSLTPEDEIKKNSLQNLARFINTVKPDLIDINLFLMGLKKDRQKEKNDSSFFNHLLKKGIPFQTLIDIGSLIYSKYNPVLFMFYQYMLAAAGKKAFHSQKEDMASFEKAMEDFCRILKGDDSDFSVMLDLIFDEYKNRELYGELAFPEEENFSGIEFILKEDSVFLKFDLSSIGGLGIFIKSAKELVLINFLSGKEEALLFLKESEGILKEMLEQNGIKKSVVGYFDSKKIVDKLELWSLDFYTKSDFNVKV
jgi:hypothetical protein